MKETDFTDNLDVNESDDDSDTDDGEDGDVATFISKNSSEAARKRDKLMGDLELIALGAGHQVCYYLNNK